MKAVNNIYRYHRVYLLASLAFLVSLSGCSSSTSHISPTIKATPTVSRSNISSAVECMGERLSNANTARAYIFLIRDLPDGTVKQGPYQNGPMSDAGRIQFINTLSENIHPHLGLVTDKYPSIFKHLSKEEIGLNRFGLPSANNVKSFVSIFRGIIDVARKNKKMPLARSIIPLVVDGSFTRMDGDNFYQQGNAHNSGSRGNNEGGKFSGQIDFGKTSSARAITLAVNLVDPRSNVIVAARSFDLQFSRTNDKKRFRIALGDGFYGFSHNEVIVEGLHSAQQTLLDAAVMWVLDKSYGDRINFSNCFSPEQQHMIGAPRAY